MKKIIRESLIVAVLFAVSAVEMKAQIPDATVFWINVYGTPPAYAHMTFGNRIGNTTSGVDTQASFPSEYREQEGCGPPSPGFDAIWGSVRGATQFGTGVRGLCGRQINEWTSTIQVDTFRINFAQADDGNQDISFHWPDAAYIAFRCDSLVMVYFNPNVGANVRLNMMTTDTLVIPAAGTNGVYYLRIFKYGAKLIDTDVTEAIPVVPADFTLLQNYPNPFNPVTAIRFQVAKRSHVLLKIYDVLGREVATLVNEVKSQGEHSVQWNAADTPSGAYFCRVLTGKFIEARKMILMR